MSEMTVCKLLLLSVAGRICMRHHTLLKLICNPATCLEREPGMIDQQLKTSTQDEKRKHELIAYVPWLPTIDVTVGKRTHCKKF
jgi:hypothetical protein